VDDDAPWRGTEGGSRSPTTHLASRCVEREVVAVSTEVLVVDGGFPAVGRPRRFAPRMVSHRGRRWAGARETLLLGLLLGAYSLVRLIAPDGPGDAAMRAVQILNLERATTLDVELPVIRAITSSPIAAMSASVWYASAHYVVTAGVLTALWFRAREKYRALRRVLVLATAAALVFYLVMPTAPPRLLAGAYPDVLAQTAGAGWWGSQGSAPRGLGGLTNQLAAFPSMHAGWALWVAVAAFVASRARVWRVLGVLHALVTAIVVVGTANHWVLDVLAGWVLVVLAAGVLLGRRGGHVSMVRDSEHFAYVKCGSGRPRWADARTYGRS
jgi:hypothetical protein